MNDKYDGSGIILGQLLVLECVREYSQLHPKRLEIHVRVSSVLSGKRLVSLSGTLQRQETYKLWSKTSPMRRDAEGCETRPLLATSHSNEPVA